MRHQDQLGRGRYPRWALVWKFFEKIENILSDQTKFEIAVVAGRDRRGRERFMRGR